MIEAVHRVAPGRSVEVQVIGMTRARRADDAAEDVGAHAQLFDQAVQERGVVGVTLALGGPVFEHADREAAAHRLG